MDGQGHQLQQVGIGRGRIRVRSWQRPAFFEQKLREVFHGAGDHQTGVGQVEALGHRAGKIECLGHHHLTGDAGEMESDMIAEHVSMIWQAAGGAAASMPSTASGPWRNPSHVNGPYAGVESEVGMSLDDYKVVLVSVQQLLDLWDPPPVAV